MYSGDYKEFTKAICYHDFIGIIKYILNEEMKETTSLIYGFLQVSWGDRWISYKWPSIQSHKPWRCALGKRKESERVKYFLFQIKKDVYQGSHFTLKITTSSDSAVWTGRSTRFYGDASPKSLLPTYCVSLLLQSVLHLPWLRDNCFLKGQ